MFANGGGDLWVMLTVIGVAVLGVAIAYSMIRSRKEMTRDKRRLQERSTDNLYDVEQRDAAHHRG